MAVHQKVPIAVFSVGVHAKVDAGADLDGSAHDRHQLIEVVVLDDGVEPDAVDSPLSHRGYRALNALAQARDPALAIVSLVEIVERDVELIDAGAPERQ